MNIMIILTPLYQLITFIILVLIVWNMFDSEEKYDKALAAMLIATFLLRTLLVK